MKTWQDETCFNCRYRVNAACRRFPPIGNGYFPQVLHIMQDGLEEFNIACAEHRPNFKPIEVANEAREVQSEEEN